MKKSVFKEGKKYTFSDYFDLNNPTEEIAAELGYTLTLAPLNLPKNSNIEQSIIDKLQFSYYELLPKITLNSEIAKREFMIAPLLYEVIRPINAKLNVEYPVEVDDKLGGVIDYLIRAQQAIVIIEAKKGDLDRGFNQLVAELIAIDKYDSDESSNFLYGAITIGEVWRFAMLKRKEKNIIRDVHTFRFPEDIKDILAMLTGVLQNEV